MGDIASSVLARLKNKAKESGRSYQLCLQLFCQEEFLRRLEKFSSRMKDYYDIYYLSHKFDFEGNILCEALSKTFSNREHIFTMEQFEQMIAFDSDDRMQKKWKAFTKKIELKMIDFSVILQSIHTFLYEPYTAVIKTKAFKKQWKAQEGIWRFHP